MFVFGVSVCLVIVGLWFIISYRVRVVLETHMHWTYLLSLYMLHDGQQIPTSTTKITATILLLLQQHFCSL